MDDLTKVIVQDSLLSMRENIDNISRLITPEKPPKKVKVRKMSLKNPLSESVESSEPQTNLKYKYDFHKSVCEKLNEIYIKKNTDYDDAFAKGIKEHGYQSAIVRIDDKLNRIKSLMLNSKSAMVNESIEDTLIDLANYALMLYTEFHFNKK